MSAPVTDAVDAERAWLDGDALAAIAAADQVLEAGTDVDGRALTFTLMSTGTMQDVAKPALDAVATVLRQCGCR